MKTVLITGASSGIGLASALAAAESGLQVVATTRKPVAELRDAGVETVCLDVTDGRSIHDCFAGVLARHGRLDALVNNAGVLGMSHTLELGSLETLRAAMDVNFFGVIAVSQAAMPHLRETRGKLITISSVRGVIGQPFNEGYSAAKFAIEGFMEALAPVAAQVGVTVSLIEPAAVLDTRFVSGVDPAAMLAAAGPYTDAFRAYRAWVATGAVEAAQQSRDVAQVVVGTLLAEKPALRIQTSQYGREYVARKLADPDGGSILDLTSSWVTGRSSS